MNVKAHHDAFYFLTFIDDYLHFNYAYLISQCFKELDCFKHFLTKVESKREMNLKILQIDKGHKYLSHKFQKLCEEKRIRR